MSSTPHPPTPVWISSSISLSIYIYYMLFDHFEEEAILKGDQTTFDETMGPNKEVFHLIHKENIKKTKEVLRKPWKL